MDLEDDPAPSLPIEASVDAPLTLEEAVTLAARAGRWDVVAMLAKELEARRLAGETNVVSIGVKRGM